ncbi:MAG: VanZ family protein [Velocimicrobium sp.]
MNRHFIKIKTFITISSIVTIGLEYGCYYFLNTLYGAMLLGLFLNLILCHIYLETSLTYLSCFLQSCISMLLSVGATVFIYTYHTGNLLIYDKKLPLIILLNWLAPLLYSLLRNFTDHGPRFVHFRSYFWRTSICFGAYYIFYFIKHFFITPSSFPTSASAIFNPFIPFLATATYVEDCIYLDQPLSVLLIYIFKTVLIFAPLGFYGAILLKEASRKIIIILTLLLPITTELISLFQKNVFSVDTYLYNVIGFLIGILLYQLLNYISNHSLQTDFLADRSKYSFFNFYY